MTEEQGRLLSVVREVYGRLIWTHKTHEKQRELAVRSLKRDRWLNVFMMGLSASGILVSILIDGIWAAILAGILAFVSTGFAVYQVSFSKETQVLLQRQAAKSLLIERELLLAFIERLMGTSIDIEQFRGEFQKTQERLGKLYESLPDTTSEAFGMATEGLKSNEEFTFSPHEIDRLLPKELRIETQSPPNRAST